MTAHTAHAYTTTRTSPFGYYGACACGWITRDYFPTAQAAYLSVRDHVAAQAGQAVTIGNGTAVHVGYFVGGNVTGSLCNPYAWQTSRVRLSDQPATCPRCAKATARAAEQARHATAANRVAGQ